MPAAFRLSQVRLHAAGAVHKSFQGTLNLPQTTLEMRAKPSLLLQKYGPRLLQAYAQNGGPKSSSKEKEREQEAFVLHDGPPYANGPLHVGHALNKILKDFILRYQLFQGKRINFIPGWDCHGLPIEIKALEAIPNATRRLSAIEIRQKAKECAKEAMAQQREGFKEWGILGDWDHPYTTFDPRYEAAQIGVFGKMAERGLIYRDFKPVYWSPSSRTALAEAELEYVDTHLSRSVFVKFRLQKTTPSLSIDLSHPTSLLIWTTTPWTLPANKAIAINSRHTYSVVEEEGKMERLIVGSELLPSLQAKLKAPWKVVDTFSGKQLVGSLYLNSLTALSGSVFDADFVTMDSGTGLVHLAPAHGLDDYKLCKSHNIEVTSLVDDNGVFTSKAGELFAGKAVLSDGNEAVIKQLQTLGALVLEEGYRHRYPYDWRTKKPVILRATEQWFATLTEIAQSAVDSLDTISFFPKTAKNRLTGTILSRTDWCISRQRVWGVPIPVFYDEEGKPLMTSETIGHIQNLIHTHGSDCWWTMSTEQLLPPAYRAQHHRYRKGEDTMDVWFDSGMSWAFLAKRLEEEGFSKQVADVYVEGSDQHRGWFQSSLLTSVSVAKRAPFQTLITHGFVLDENGRKMSKSLGNVIDPRVVIHGGKDKKKNPEYGADVLRLWVAATDYSSDVYIGPTILEKVSEAQRKFRNSLRFALSNLYDFGPQNLVPLEALSALDRYMLTSLQLYGERVTQAYEQHDFVQVFRESTLFAATELSSFYFDILKDPLYADSPSSHRRRSAQTTLFHILRNLTLSLAPITSFLAEEIFEHSRKIYGASQESIFQTGWLQPLPKFEREFADFTQLRQLKARVNQAVEGLREKKLINASLEASLVLRLASNSDLIGCIKRNADTDFANFFKVSQFSLSESELDPDAEPEIEVSPSKHQKCPRCWNFQGTQEGGLCPRCVGVLKEIPSPQFA